MSTTLTYTGTLVTEECYSCHIMFAMPADFQRRCRDAGRAMSFYCPLGHSQVYSVSRIVELENELARVKRQKEWAETNSRRIRDELQMTERSRAAIKGQLTKTKKRVANGVCPCCKRHFVNVERHMNGQHPDYAEAES